MFYNKFNNNNNINIYNYNLNEVINLINYDDYLIIFIPRDCLMGYGVLKLLRDKYNLSNILLNIKLNKNNKEFIKIIGVYDNLLNKIINIIICIVRDNFYSKEDIYINKVLNNLNNLINNNNNNLYILSDSSKLNKNNLYKIINNKLNNKNIIII